MTTDNRRPVTVTEEKFQQIEAMVAEAANYYRAKGQRELLLHQLQARFGKVHYLVRQQLENGDFDEDMDDFAIRLLDANSLKEL